jgi:hypothetical protein
VINNDGIFSMHPEVIQEVREKTPTPAFKGKDGKASDTSIFLKFLNGTLDGKDSNDNKSKKKGKKN